MPNKSNSKDLKVTDKLEEDVEILSEDLGFWNIDADSKDIESTPEDLIEINKILSENKLNRPLKTLSENEINLAPPCEKEIISDLESYSSTQSINEISDIFSKNIDELVASDDVSEDVVKTADKASAPASLTKEKTPRTTTELFASIFCYLAIAGIFVYLINYASVQHNFDSETQYESNIPVDGQYASIEKIDTFWSKPEGKYGLKLVPAATITLSPTSQSGILRSVFYSAETDTQGKLKPKGDPFTHEFRNGKFNRSGTNQITIFGTDGFRDFSHFIFYRNQTEKRWTIEIKEAPSNQTNDYSFQPLAKAPIEPLRK